MHTLRELSRGLGAQHVLPGILLLILAVVALCIWEARRLIGSRSRLVRQNPTTSVYKYTGQTGGGRDRLIALSGIVLGAASCVLIAARFIWVA